MGVDCKHINLQSYQLKNRVVMSEKLDTWYCIVSFVIGINTQSRQLSQISGKSELGWVDQLSHPQFLSYEAEILHGGE